MGQLLSAQAAAHDTATVANAERIEREHSHRSAEDRWMQEVDRARQEVTRQAMIVVQRDKVIERMTTAHTELQERLRVASAAAAAAGARAHTLQTVRASQPSKGGADPKAWGFER